VPWDAIDIVGACLCWDIDSNLTHKATAQSWYRVKHYFAELTDNALAGFLTWVD